jgi:hypothetical protein
MILRVKCNNPFGRGLGSVTDYRYCTIADPKSGLLTTVSLPQLLTPVYLTIQLLTLVILATYFMYIVYLISIDLESSRSFNSPTLQSLQGGI